jgi:hypothetical protein
LSSNNARKDIESDSDVLFVLERFHEFAWLEAFEETSAKSTYFAAAKGTDCLGFAG